MVLTSTGVKPLTCDVISRPPRISSEMMQNVLKQVEIINPSTEYGGEIKVDGVTVASLKTYRKFPPSSHLQRNAKANTSKFSTSHCTAYYMIITELFTFT